MLIICDLRNQGRLAAKSAMSSRFPCVAAIIEKSTALAMKRHGGKRQALIQLFAPVSCGCKVIHYRQRMAKALQRPNNGSVGVRMTKRSRFLRLVRNDALQTDRVQPS